MALELLLDRRFVGVLADLAPDIFRRRYSERRACKHFAVQERTERSGRLGMVAATDNSSVTRY